MVDTLNKQININCLLKPTHRPFGFISHGTLPNKGLVIKIYGEGGTKGGGGTRIRYFCAPTPQYDNFCFKILLDKECEHS